MKAINDADISMPESASPPSVPRWVKLFAIVALGIMLLAIAAMFIVGGQHGPGRHSHGNDTAVDVAPSRVDA
jgi:hypothetical protein